jgi:hypothetical protein
VTWLPQLDVGAPGLPLSPLQLPLAPSALGGLARRVTASRMTATATSSTRPMARAETGSMVKSGFGRPLPPPLAWSRRGAGHGENVHGASRASARSSAESGDGAGAGAGGGEGGEKASAIRAFRRRTMAGRVRSQDRAVNEDAARGQTDKEGEERTAYYRYTTSLLQGVLVHKGTSASVA